MEYYMIYFVFNHTNNFSSEKMSKYLEYCMQISVLIKFKPTVIPSFKSLNWLIVSKCTCEKFFSKCLGLRWLVHVVPSRKQQATVIFFSLH